MEITCKEILFDLICFLFIGCAPSFFAYKKEYRTSLLLCLFSVLTLVAINAKSFSAFKFGPIEARAKETINQANDTIEKLKQVALVVSKPMYEQLADVKKNSPLSFKVRNQRKEEIDDALRNLGIPPEKIREVSCVWNVIVAQGLAKGIISFNEDVSVFDEWNALNYKYNRDLGQSLPPEEIQSFLEKNNIKDDVFWKRFDNYKNFLKTGVVRDPQYWPKFYDLYYSDNRCDDVNKFYELD